MRKASIDKVTDEELADLKTRLRGFRAVPVPDLGPGIGVNPELLAGVLQYWGDEFDWRSHEQRIHGWGWWETEHTPIPVRAVVRPANRPDAPVVVLLHGWPDSVLRFERLLPLLDDITVVVPALPGFPFAAPVAGGGMSSIEMADAIAAAMTEFGYNEYVISAGDVGCDVAEAIAARHTATVSALHLTDLSQYHFLGDLPEDLDYVEREYVERGHAWQRESGGYMHQQATRPGTLAVGLGDSPAALAAWILEKLTDWTDRNGDLGGVFTTEEILTWVSAYWFTRSIGTSFAPYAAATKKDWPKIAIPTVMTVFPADLVNAPRQFVERLFTVADWLEFPHGGHFAAWEQPTQYAQGIRRALELRPQAIR